MRVAVFSTKRYDHTFFEEANAAYGHQLDYFEPRLTLATTQLGHGYDAVCIFPNDVLCADALKNLAQHGLRLVALRCAGYNNVDLQAAHSLGVRVVRVPAYSPYAIAEHTLALILTLNRKTHRAYNRVREGNFSLDGLMGFDLNEKTVGVIGTGKIGMLVAKIMMGFGCRVLATDRNPNPDCLAMGVSYVDLRDLCQQSDIISLHCPLTPETHHLINAETLGWMKPGVMIINTSRGATIDTAAAIDGLKSGQVGYLGLDVYEEEGDLFFEDLSSQVIQDDMFTRLLTFPNVLITGHQAFFTQQAMAAITHVTLNNISDVEAGRPCPNEVLPPMVAANAA
jgi:D-lactate dehydrogenase